MLLIFMKERRMRLAVGDGLRKAIPDTAASDILATIVAPRFARASMSWGYKKPRTLSFKGFEPGSRLKENMSFADAAVRLKWIRPILGRPTQDRSGSPNRQ